MRDYFRNWDYKKHTKFVTSIYAFLYIVDMTLGYIVAKKVLNDAQKKKLI